MQLSYFSKKGRMPYAIYWQKDEVRLVSLSHDLNVVAVHHKIIDLKMQGRERQSVLQDWAREINSNPVALVLSEKEVQQHKIRLPVYLNKKEQAAEIRARLPILNSETTCFDYLITQKNPDEMEVELLALEKTKLDFSRQFFLPIKISHVTSELDSAFKFNLLKKNFFMQKRKWWVGILLLSLIISFAMACFKKPPPIAISHKKPALESFKFAGYLKKNDEEWGLLILPNRKTILVQRGSTIENMRVKQLDSSKIILQLNHEEKTIYAS